jgi:CheY-like chemotaxis protein
MSGTLLLADDSITIQKVVELTFAETEHKVFTVGSGRDLLQRLPEIKPDVVLCDVVMPDMNGYEVCQILKSDPSTLHIPVVLLTGTFEPFDRDRAQAAGCDAIVTKPFEARELIGVVEDLLARVQSVAAPPAPVDWGGMGEQGIPDGVPALDFSTSGFDRMVPEEPPAPAIPEDGIDLTASSLGDSHPSQPISAPPELAEPEVPTAVSAPLFVSGGEAPHAFAAAPESSAPVAIQSPESAMPEPASARPAAPEPFLIEEAQLEPAGDFIALEPAPVQEPAVTFAPELVVTPEPENESGLVFAPEVVTAPPVKRAMDEEEKQRFAAPPTEPPSPAPAGGPGHAGALAGMTAAVPASIAAAALSHETMEHIARRVVELIPPPPSAPAPLTAADLMTDEHVERVARRAAELVPPPPPPPTAAELLTDEHVERVARRAAELVPPPAAPAVPEPLSDEQIEKIARKVVELAAPQLERIAWEVIPDMAEMLVRTRIAELEKAAEEES